MTENNVVGAYFGPGSAGGKRAVLYQGEFQNEHDGTGIAVRLHARALALSGVNVALKSITGQYITAEGVMQPMHTGLPDRIEEEVGHLYRHDSNRYYPAIRHLVLHKPEHVSQLLLRGVIGHLDDSEKVMVARKLAYDSTVLYTVWERDRVSPAIVRELNKVREVWVPCEQNASMLRSCGVERVFVVPHPFDKSGPLAALVRRRATPSRRFYSIGRWEPRKNFHGLILAFCEAFSPKDDVQLTLKVSGSWPDYATPEEIVQVALQRSPQWTAETLGKKLHIIHKNLRPDQIVKLHYENNIFVTASCGEAWGLPAFEAKVAGNRVVATDFGGTQDFCEPDRGDVLLPTTLTAVPDSYGWGEGAQWGSVSQQLLVRTFRSLEAPSQYSRSQEFDDKFSLQSVGERMRERLLHLYPGAFE